jgi:hypothetical protein
VYVVDNPAAGNAGPVAGAPGAEAAALAFTGRMDATAQAFISTDGSTWVPLGLASPMSIQLQRTSASTVHGPDHAPVGIYTHVRLVLQNVLVQVAAGSVFGPVTLTGPVNVSLAGSGQGIVIDREIPNINVQVEGGIGPTITFDLNAEAWLTQQSVDAATVGEATVRQAVSLSYQLP